MIEAIEMSNWKNFENLNLSMSKGINFIAGPNGIGKSSVLEAICVAFTGQMPKGIEIRDCIRRGAKFASIRLDFRKGNETLRINRIFSQRAREQSSICTPEGNIIFEGSWDEVTDYIENLLKIHSFIFNEVVFTSEGDVYRSIKEPPGKQLLNEIDRVLGITKLQSLETELGNVRKEFQKEATKQQQLMEKVAVISTSEGDLSIAQNKLSDLQRSRTKMTEKRNAIQREIWDKKDKIRGIETLLSDLLAFEKESKEVVVEQDKVYNLEKQLALIQNEIKTLEKDEIAAESTISNHQKILDILKEAQSVSGLSAKCPVCKKPISEHEMVEIKKEIEVQKDLTESKRLEIVTKLDKLNNQCQNIESRLHTLKEREMRLKVLEEKYRKYDMQSDEAKKRLTKFKVETESLESQYRDLDKSLIVLESEIGDLREEIGRIESAEQYRSIGKTEIMENLKTAFVGEYLTDFTLSGIDEVLSEQRDSILRNRLYNSISEIWSNFKGENGWSVALDEGALPSLHQKSQNFPFHLLSAGEKTALLIITRTMLSALFTKEVGFTLLDEPLEHLDPRNRHSLLQFLVDAHREGIVNQLIVTTTEISLLRKFVDLNSVNIIMLPKRLE